MKVIELLENEPRFLPEKELLDDAAVRMQRSGFVDVEFPNPLNKRQFVLRSTGVVGLVPVDNTLMLRIAPKVPVVNLFGMLELVHDLPSFRFYEGIGRVDAIEDIYGRLARMLARGVIRRVRRGLDSEYQGLADDLDVVRGRIAIPDTLRLQSRGSARLRCEFESRTVDIDRNRILLWALDRIPRLGLNAGEAMGEVREARRALLGAVTLVEMSAEDCKRQLYNRLNVDYGILHALARFFIECMGPGVSEGSHRFLPFTVNMAALFQDYVVACLSKSAPPGVVVHRQYHAPLEGDLDVRFQMDAVVADARSGRALAIVDAKYKADTKPTTADIHQVVAYAAHLGAPLALLVYPTMLRVPGRVAVGVVSRIEVALIGMPLDVALSDARQLLIRSVFGNLFPR